MQDSSQGQPTPGNSSAPPFLGLKVIDIASFIAGPAATTVLSDLGADVIKVEAPGMGDPHRYTYLSPPNPAPVENYSWLLTNRNKRSLVVDLKTSSGAKILKRLVAWADVMVTNFPLRVRLDLGIDYDRVRNLNKRLIYAEVSGYGNKGAEANRPDFDLTAYWARAGLMYVTRDASAPPTGVIPGLGAHATAISLYASIVTGLYRRERTGLGCSVSTSLLAEGAWANGMWLQAALLGARFSGEMDRFKSPSALFAQSYQTNDRRWILLSILEESKFWEPLLRALGRADLDRDERFQTARSRQLHASALVEILDQTFGSESMNYWSARLGKEALPFGVIQTPEEVVNDPQLYENEIIVPMDDENPSPRRTVASPVGINECARVKPRLAPGLGEHTREILRELTFTEREIAAFREEGVISRPGTEESELR